MHNKVAPTWLIEYYNFGRSEIGISKRQQRVKVQLEYLSADVQVDPCQVDQLVCFEADCADYLYLLYGLTYHFII